MQLLDELVLPKDITIADVSQSIQEFEIERDALQEFFDDMLKTYTTYQEMKDLVKRTLLSKRQKKNHFEDCRLNISKK